MRFSTIAAIVFLAIGLVAGFISDWIVSALGWEMGLLTSFLGFAIFFGLLVYMGRAKMGLTYLLMFCVLGFVSAWISGFLGDMWGISGSLYGSALTVGVLFVLILLIGPQKTGIQTAETG